MQCLYKSIIFLMIIASCLILPLKTEARVWVGHTGDRSWSNPANWNNSLSPGVDDFFYFNLIEDSVVFLNGNQTSALLRFGDFAPSQNWIVQPGTPATSRLILDAANNLSAIEVVNQAAIFRVPIGGNEGLLKTGDGTLVLTRPNTYTGRTNVPSGTLMLDLSDPGASPGNIIPLGSEVRLGGLTSVSGGGTLELIGAPGASSSQFLSNTTLEFGQNAIRVRQNGAAHVDLSLGLLDRDVGSVLNLTLPTAGAILAQSATIPNIQGILGGWATIGSGVTATWAANDGVGNIVPYVAFTDVTVAPMIDNGPASNVRWSGSTGDAALAAGATDINTLMFTDSSRRAVTIPAGGVLRMGMSGGIFKTDATAGEATSLLTIGASGTFLTAGGGPNLVGELILNANSNAPDQNGIIVNSTIANNGAAPVTVIKSGNASALFTASNTYTDGTYITGGRLRTNASGGFGTGPVYVGTGAQAYLDAGTHANNFFISGRGFAESPQGLSGGAVQLAGNGVTVTGNVNLLGAAQIGAGGAAGNGAIISGRITGSGDVEFSSGGNGVLTLTNTGNNWTGNTIIGPGVLRIGGAGEVIPSSSRKIIIHGDPLTSVPSVLDLNGKTETVQGFLSSGDAQKVFVRNGAIGSATLRLAVAGNTVSDFGGVIEDGTGNVGLFLFGGGVQVLSGANTYSGPTALDDGILRLGSSLSLPTRTAVMLGNRGWLDLAGFNATLSNISGTGSTAVINSSLLSASVLTIAGGNNVFGGRITHGGAPLGLTVNGGTLTLTGVNTYTGPTTLNGGTLRIAGALDAASDVTVKSGATLVAAPLVPQPTFGRVGNVIMEPGSSFESVGTATLSSLSVNGGDMRFGLRAGGMSDRVNVVGTATFNGPSTITPTSLIPGTYTLLTADTLRGIPPILNAPTGARATFALSFETLADQIRLIVSGSGPKSLTWTGANGSEWDLNTTANWTDGTVAEKFFNLDSVTFGDGPTNRNVVLNTTVVPVSVTVNNTVGNDYTISGTGGIGNTGFGGATSLTKNGPGTLNLGGTNAYLGATTINAGLLRITGSIASNNLVAVSAPATFAVEGTATVGNLQGAGRTTVGNGATAATLTATFVRQASLAIENGSSVNALPNGGPGGTSVLGSLSIAGAPDAWTAKLNLSNNDAVVQSTTANKTADLGRLYNQLKQGFNNGTWTGLGITSATAAANPNTDTGLAVVDNALLGYTAFSGQPVTANSILLKYTYYGDIDLNGQVDADDLTVFANSFGRVAGATQVDGDIDFNGTVDADDLTVFANNFNKGIGAPLALGNVATVPEPATILLVGVTGLLLLPIARRMRGRQTLNHLSRNSFCASR